MDPKRRTCLECVYCYVSGYSRGWSEMTPSSPITISCSKDLWGNWSYDENLNKNKMIADLDMAIGCALFEPDPEVEGE